VDWTPGDRTPPELRALDYLMMNLGLITSEPARLVVRLRPHPSESSSKYAVWARRNSHAALQISDTTSLAEDVAWADTVAGLHSYALVIARVAGRRAVSYLPPGAPPCALRFPGIESLSTSAGDAP
jgi:hypothetical protein